MLEMSLKDAQLFKLLGGFFGRDRVVWNMSVRAVCGGQYPKVDGPGSEPPTKWGWAEAAGCLFTIVDSDDTPKMVVEFAIDSSSNCIDLTLLERQESLPKLLELCGVRYISISDGEFQEILDPSSSLDLTALLKDRLGISQSSDGDGDEDGNN
jgi:hypothetical protein